jgi:hypothetical protein
MRNDAGSDVLQQKGPYGQAVWSRKSRFFSRNDIVDERNKTIVKICIFAGNPI